MLIVKHLLYLTANYQKLTTKKNHEITMHFVILEIKIENNV